MELLHNHYLAERYCYNCDKYTQHDCKDSGHERDSSGDYEECLECNWYRFGMFGKYNPPLKDV